MTMTNPTPLPIAIMGPAFEHLNEASPHALAALTQWGERNRARQAAENSEVLAKQILVSAGRSEPEADNETR